MESRSIFLKFIIGKYKSYNKLEKNIQSLKIKKLKDDRKF